MNLSDLLQAGKLRKGEPDPKQAADCIKAAERDIHMAKKTFGENLDWSFSIAYNAALQATRALMFSEGYYAVGEGHHKTAVDYAAAKFGQKFGEEMELFDRFRKKRNEAVYFNVGAVSEFETKQAIAFASLILQKVKEKMGRR